MKMTAYTPRKFEVPAALVAAGYAPTVDLDVLDWAVELPGEFGEWAERVLFQENSKILNDVCGDDRLLPRGILSSVQLDDESYLVAGLVNSDGKVWEPKSNNWVVPDALPEVETGTITLSDDEVAYVARALREGADEVWFRPFIPKAFVSSEVSAVTAAPAPPFDRTGKKAKAPEEDPTPQEVPDGSAIIAVVDPIDEDAVLEMLAIAPGPKVMRRHAGMWYEDPEWIPVLRSVKPPKIVKLSEAQVASVATQVDRSTSDQDWEPFDADSREQYQIFTASAAPDDSEVDADDFQDIEENEVPGIATHAVASSSITDRSPYLQELQRESDEVAIQSLLAVAGREITPKDKIATERLKRYWTVGKGAAKIRWGTPGAWRRCYRHLVKYVGPKIAPGYCTNLSQRLGGPGVATHVGTKAKKKLTSSAEPQGQEPEALVAANPTGKNGYDTGMSFSETKVKRDYRGRFAPGGGSSNRSARAKRRKASMERSKKAREEKKAKSSKSATSKADKEKRDRQREELAQLSLQISQASAAGDTIKAAELRVQRAEKRLSFATTNTERLNAQTALVNAQNALRRAKEAAAKKKAKEQLKKQPKRPDYWAGVDAKRRSDSMIREFDRRDGDDGVR